MARLARTCGDGTRPYPRVLFSIRQANLTAPSNPGRDRPTRASADSEARSKLSGVALLLERPLRRTLKMKKLITLLVATLALALVAFTPDIASAGRGHGGGHGGHGGGHWHGGAVMAAATPGAAAIAAGTAIAVIAATAIAAIAAIAATAGAAGGAQASPSRSAAMDAAAGPRPTAITPAATAGAIRACCGLKHEQRGVNSAPQLSILQPSTKR